ncbi:MAG: GNAT family N-acetyltransferase [Verrucomicrobia bacterium]|nr:GNAT family N-acetyltransferase [Verrucomicrobiota bacterium]
MKRFFIRVVSWSEAQLDLLAVRHEVFVIEQKVPEELEIDGLDGECEHVLAEDVVGKVIGTARLLPEGRIGRVAVLRSWRRCGVGAALMRKLEGEAVRKGMSKLELHAQSSQIPFYEKIGYIMVEGEEFLDAGIAHRLMEKKLQFEV